MEPMISAGERQQTYALDRAATGTGITVTVKCLNLCCRIYNENEERVLGIINKQNFDSIKD
jgi:hypothetical protein